jgi:hypothetical protein
VRKVLVLLALSCTLANATGRFIPFPQGPKLHRARLLQERKSSLPKGSVGPLKTINLRYDEEVKGEKRTFVWCAESYRSAEGKMLYLVLGAEYSQGRPVYLVDELGPTLKTHKQIKNPRLVPAFAAWDEYVTKQNLAARLAP